MADLTDRVCAAICSGHTTAPAGAPKGINGVSDAMDELW